MNAHHVAKLDAPASIHYITAPHPKDLLVMLSVCNSDVFSNMRQLVVVTAISLIRSCKAERSFSVFRHTKSHMCASMGQDRQAGLTIMAMHSSHAQQVDTQTIVKEIHPQTNPQEAVSPVSLLTAGLTGIHLDLRQTCPQHTCFLELLVSSVGFCFPLQSICQMSKINTCMPSFWPVPVPGSHESLH